MKLPVNGEKGVKDEFCTLQFAEVDSEESEQVTWEGGTTHSCQILTKPGVPIAIQSSINLGEGVTEFIDYVIDGILRSSSTPRTGLGKKYTYKVKADKVLAHRFEGGRKKGLKTCGMEAKLRSARDEKNVKSKDDAPETSVSTIEVQHWRKSSEDSESQPSSDQLDQDVKRAPSYDKFPRWTDLEQSLPDDTPHEYAISFTGDKAFSKTLKERVAQEKPGFKLFRAFKFHLVSPKEFQKLGGAAPRDLPQVVIPSKENAKEKTKSREKDKKVLKSVKGKEKESGESSKAKPKTPNPEKSSWDVAKPQKTGENSGAEESTTKEKAGEGAEPIEINSQSTVHTPDTSEPTTNGAEPVAVLDSPVKDISNDQEQEPEKEEELKLEQDHNDEHAKDHSNILLENNSTIREQSQNHLEDYHMTCDEILKEHEAANSSAAALLGISDVEMDLGLLFERKKSLAAHEDSDVDLDLAPAVTPTFTAKKPSFLNGMKGGPADQAARDLAHEEEMQMRSSVEDVIRGRSSTSVQRQSTTGDGEISKEIEGSLMTPPPSTQKPVGSIQIQGFPTPFNLQSPTRALSPFRNIHQVLVEGAGNYTALKTAPRRSSLTDTSTEVLGNLIQGMDGLNPLDLSTPIESWLPGSQRGNALLRGRQAGRDRSASPAPRSYSRPNYRSREWDALNGDDIEDIPDLFRPPFSRIGLEEWLQNKNAAVQPTEKEHKVQAVQEARVLQALEQPPHEESEQEKDVRRAQNIAQKLAQKSIEKARKIQEVAPEVQKEKEPTPSLPRTPTQRVAASTVVAAPKSQRTAAPRATTPPTPTPKSRPSAQHPPVQRPSKKPLAPAPAVQTVPSKKQERPPTAQPESSKKPQAAVQPSKKTQLPTPDVRPTSSKKSQAPAPAVQPATSKKRKADSANTDKNIDNRPIKHASAPASREVQAKQALARRMQEVKARIEAAKKESEKLKEEEDMIMEVQKLEEEARQIEQDNALRKSNIERVGGSFA